MNRGHLLALALAVVFAACWLLYRQGADFPTHFFPDEPGKVEQVAENFRNFRHPNLLLETVSLASRLAGAHPGREAPGDKAIVSRVGRSVSAAYAAGAVSILCLLGFSLAGWQGLLLAALAVGLCPPLLVHAHYFKEDSPLVFGFALTALAGHNLILRSRTGTAGGHEFRFLRPALLLGLAAGVALSAKYIGAAALAAALGLILFTQSVRLRRRVLGCILCILGAGAVFLLVNWRLIGRPVARHAFVDSFTFEASHGVSSHRGIIMRTPTSYFVEMAFRQLGVVVLAGVVVCIVAQTLRRRRGLPSLPVSRSYCFLLVLGTGFLAMLTLCPLADARYALPAVVLLGAAGSIGWACSLRLLHHVRSRSIATLALAGAIGGLYGVEAANIIGQFRDDSRYRLIEWAAANLPPDAEIVQDARAGLTRTVGRAGQRLAATQRVRSSMFAADLGTLDELVQEGMQFVVVVDAAYQRFLDPRLSAVTKANGDERRSYIRNRVFYTELLQARGRLIWTSGPSPTGSMYPLTNPEIRVYRLPAEE